ncbi:MAG: FkbM family methyltransferase [Flavobacteriales bacterium]|nr:FkbM family methyltransferase [Flavobacteriales bacterium]
MWLANLLSVLPFTVNVSGRKHDFIVNVGRKLNSDPSGIKLNGHRISTKGHPNAHIIAFAGKNFLRNFHQSDLGNYMRSSLKRGDLFVDIGANLGGFSLLAQGMGARSIAVEAAPELAAFLSENEQSFGEVHTVAVSDKAGSATFYLSDSNIGGNSLTMSSEGWEASGYSRETEVVTQRLDDLLSEVGTIDLLKIDVEGHEEAAIKGCEELFNAGKVKAVWCEVRSASSDRNPNSYRAVCEHLDSKGFQAFRYRGNAIPFDWKKDQELPQFFDLLFLLK